ncbi:MAG: efflux RND transporter periplasmic adaptor subunit [Balneolales bacterium]|nr:efflux RND transporter periplasmic adaptor subunit [Balneolales bacterium]
MSTKKRKKKQFYIASGTSVLLILFSFLISSLLSNADGAEEPADQGDQAREVSLLDFEITELEAPIRLNGRVRALNRIELFSEVQGVLLEGDRRFRTGTSFNRGDILLRLDEAEAAFELASMRSRFVSAIATLLPAFRTDFPDRLSVWSAFAESIDPSKPLPELPEAANRQERFFLAANDIPGQYFAIRAMEKRLEKFTIRAPFSGELKQAEAFPGSLIQPGVNLGVFSGNLFELEAFISLQERSFIEIGNPITLRSANGTEFQGRISRIGRSVDPGTQSFPVFASIESPELRDGVYLEGEVKGRVMQNVVEIPRNLLSRENTVLLIEDETAVHRSVEPVLFSQQSVWVRGIEPNDKVIDLRAGMSMLAGSRVRPAE